MQEITVTFQKLDGIPQATTISLDVKLSEFREAAQTLLNLPEYPPYQLILDRTGEILSDSKTFREVGIQQDDKLILISPPESLVRYTLKLSVISDGNKPKNYDYSIELEESYEDKPKCFFSDFNGRERQKFETSLKQVVPRELQRFEIDQILEEWCDDIAFGYKNTTVEI